MTAVLDGYRDRAVGRRLKLFQRADALKRGITLIEWTFDPLVAKNAHFNFMRLGAIARRYLPNAYGVTTSPLHGSLPTDRLVAEWRLTSPRVRRILTQRQTATAISRKAVRIPIPYESDTLRATDPGQAKRIQSEVRAKFIKWFARGYIATALLPGENGMDYILESGRTT